MRTCLNCHSEIKDGVKFCTECGQPVGNEAKSNITNNQQYGTSQETQTVNKSHNVEPSTNTDKANQIIQNYMKYFERTLKKPSSSFRERNQANGYIQFFLLAFISSVMGIFLNNYYMGSSTEIIDFIRSFVIQLGLSMATVAVVYLLKKFFYKSNDSFSITATQFGGLLTINVVIQTVMLLFSIISPGGLPLLMLSLSIIGIAVGILAFNVYLFSNISKSNMDKFYVALIGNLVMCAIYALIVKAGVNQVLSEYQSIFNSLLSNLY